MKRSYLSIILLLCLTLCFVGCGGGEKEESNEVVDGYFTYVLLSDGTYAVKATDKTDFPSTVTIPESFDGIAVTQIADNGFGGCVGLREITVPKTVKRIPNAAFYRCPDLEEIHLPSGLTGIGNGAFGVCEQALTIYFDGTKKEWESISKAGNWESETEYDVICTDGTIS